MTSKILSDKFNEVSEVVKKAADDWLTECSGFSGAGGAEERRMARKDARDIRKVASLLKKGDIDGARKHAENLDTLVREVVPGAFWELSDAFKRLLAVGRKP